MFLFNPHEFDPGNLDEASREIMLKTIQFFEEKGKARIKEDDHQRIWYADFLEFVKKEQVFATLLTPARYGSGAQRWDTYRIARFNEILGFYGLAYWYTWQVSILGLGPVWMSENEEVKQRAADLLREGAVFAFGLSERDHGADVYSTEMTLTPQDDGTWLANGSKYYIGNGNEAPLVSTLGKMADTGEFVFFAADFQHEKYELVKNVVASQNFVAEFALHDYPVTEADIIARGDKAWDTAMNTVNIGKYNLGWSSIGMCTHAFHEVDQPRLRTRALRKPGDRLPPRAQSVRRRLRAPGRHAPLCPARRRLHACRLGRRSALPALQRHRQDEGDHRGRAGDQPALGRDRRQGIREGHLFRNGGTRHPGSAQAGGHGPRQHRADHEVHGQLLLQAG